MKKNQWFISIKKHDGDPFDLSNLKHNYPPEGMYWADPFLWQKDGIDYGLCSTFIISIFI